MNSAFKQMLLIVVLLLVAIVLYRSFQPGSSTPDIQVASRGSQEANRRHRSPRAQEERPSSSENHVGSCSALGITCASSYFAAWSWPQDGSCVAGSRKGFPIPDPRCTPGGVVPGLAAETLRDPQWRTKCVRNCQSSEKQKHVTYAWYGLAAPSDNNGSHQICELDHLVPLELGGADGLGNIWPECGPNENALKDRYFKRKDLVENYLASEVKAGRMPLEEAQRGIASDWTQYLGNAAGSRQR